MENEQLFGNPELNSGPPAGQLTPPCYLSLNWDQSMDHGPHFDSALSSLVSSPSSATPAAAAESVVIRELIGRLGSICNSGEISPTSRYHSTNTSCYSTPLNSPPKLNLSMMEHNQLQQGRGGLPPISGGQLAATHLAPFSADPSFVERAARLSCFKGSRSYSSGLAAQFGLSETRKLSRVSSSQSLKMGGSQMGGGAPESGNEIPRQDSTQFEMDMVGSAAQEESSMSELITMVGDASLKKACESNARKRKAALKGKGKESPLSSIAVNTPKLAEEEDVNLLKRCKSSEINGTEKDSAVKPKTEQNGGESSSGDADKKQGKDAKSPEPPKDYIHVRARRGQATDSHSLAERVRREKISERMKFLQDLVPGCNKVTGKAVMLDEIINYVQSLQRQVEFLSMKLAAVNPSLDFNMESVIPKEMNQACGPMPHHSVYPLESTSTAIMYPHQPQGTSLQSAVSNRFETQYSMNHSDSGLGRTPSMQLPPLHGFGDANSQLGTFWEDDLQSVVQMSIGQNQEAAFFSENFHGRLSGRLG